ncbi:MAG: diguanylate cyclase [Clostridiales bacterium]|nr:diguanylate cyclase [Clostridiales bacterium]
MKKFIIRFYLIGLAVTFTVALGMILEYNVFKNVVSTEVQKNIILSRDYISSEIEVKLMEKSQTIINAKSIIQLNQDDGHILEHLEQLMKDSPSFASLYYGSSENEMINASGWIPPPGFDLTQRPWYLNAAESGDLVYTDAFLNASKDHLIVTIAAPLYDEDNELRGVVAGDILLDSIIDIVNNQIIDNEGYSFLVDGNYNILAHPNTGSMTTLNLLNISDISKDVVQIFDAEHESLEIITLDNTEGYLAFEEITGTSWIVASFIPIKEYLTSERQLQYTFIFAIFSMTLIMFISVLFQRKYLIKPLAELDRDIKKISYKNDLSYRLPTAESDIFTRLRTSVNASLEKTDTFFKALVESEKRNRAILNVHPDLIFLCSQDGTFLDYQPNADYEPIQFSRLDFIGKHISDILPEGVTNMLLSTIQMALNENDIQTIEFTMDLNNSLQYFEARLVSASHDTVLAIVRNVTEERLNQKLIENLSYRDQLTGIYNRRFYEEELNRLNTERNLPIGLILLDVNGLKLTNDAFGHQMGDALLKRVAKIISGCCRTDDIIARLGGDEFVILLPKTSKSELALIVDRIYSHMSTEELGSLKISVSIGYDLKEKHDQNIKDIFTKAEDKMYHKKLIESQIMRQQTVHSILETINKNDPREKKHSENVSRNSVLIGKAYGLSQEKLKALETAGIMHDIGKIAVDSTLLNKQSTLTESEYIEIKRHSEIGYQILKSVDLYTSLAEIILHHHERWDGKGYPYGLAGEDIPLLSRIIALTDAYEAIRSDRPYRTGRSHREALLEIQKNSGTQFDPKLVEILIELDHTIEFRTDQ